MLIKKWAIIYTNDDQELTTRSQYFNTLRPRQHGHLFPDDIFKCIFVNENVWISIKFSLNIVPDGPINNIPALVQIMAWCRLGDKPLSEPMMVLLLMHMCVTRPQWVNSPCNATYFVIFLKRTTLAFCEEKPLEIIILACLMYFSPES